MKWIKAYRKITPDLIDSLFIKSNQFFTLILSQKYIFIHYFILFFRGCGRGIMMFEKEFETKGNKIETEQKHISPLIFLEFTLNNGDLKYGHYRKLIYDGLNRTSLPVTFLISPEREE